MITRSGTLRGLDDTESLGRAIAEVLQPGDRVLLRGEMGVGKTTLARAIGVALSAEPALSSPTFVLASVHRGRLPIWHLDAYRLPEGSDPMALGLDQAEQASGVTIVEWPERLQMTAPPGSGDLDVRLDGTADEGRLVEIAGLDSARIDRIARTSGLR